jgi:hypothetical protein
MKIDIDKLTEQELVDLNHRIVARLRFLAEMRAHTEMLEFSIGDRVVFQPPGHGNKALDNPPLFDRLSVEGTEFLDLPSRL